MLRGKSVHLESQLLHLFDRPAGVAVEAGASGLECIVPTGHWFYGVALVVEDNCTWVRPRQCTWVRPRQPLDVAKALPRG
jgi:hypothetical protein